MKSKIGMKETVERKGKTQKLPLTREENEGEVVYIDEMRKWRRERDSSMGGSGRRESE